MTPASAVVAWTPPPHVTNSFTWLIDWWIVNFFLPLLSLIPWRRMRRLLWWTGRLLTSYTKPVYTLRLGRDYSFCPSWYHYTSHGVFYWIQHTLHSRPAFWLFFLYDGETTGRKEKLWRRGIRQTVMDHIQCFSTCDTLWRWNWERCLLGRKLLLICLIVSSCNFWYDIFAQYYMTPIISLLTDFQSCYKPLYKPPISGSIQGHFKVRPWMR